MLISSDQKTKFKENSDWDYEIISQIRYISEANHRSQPNGEQGYFLDSLQIQEQLEATEQAPSSAGHRNSVAANGTLCMCVA